MRQARPDKRDEQDPPKLKKNTSWLDQKRRKRNLLEQCSPWWLKGQTHFPVVLLQMPGPHPPQSCSKWCPVQGEREGWRVVECVGKTTSTKITKTWLHAFCYYQHHLKKSPPLSTSFKWCWYKEAHIRTEHKTCTIVKRKHVPEARVSLTTRVPSHSKQTYNDTGNSSSTTVLSGVCCANEIPH